LQLLGTAVAIHSEEALAALPAAHVALTVGKHAVKYVIFEHLRHAGIGIAHFLATGDASPDLTDSDIEVLQRFADEIADAVQNLELSDEQIAVLLAREAGIEVDDDDDDESFDAAVAQFFTRPSPARSGV
jgi:GAF domain-containing protein